MISSLRDASRFWPGHLVLTILWTVCVLLCVTFSLLEKGWHLDEAMADALTPYLWGSLFGGYLAFLTSSAYARHRPATARFAFMFAALTICTLAAVLLAFILWHRAYFTQWHADFPSITWMFEFVFTALGSIFLFALSGVRPLLPWGVVTLFSFSFLFSRGWLPGSR